MDRHQDKTLIRVPAHRTPIHPGEILLDEFLEPMGISQYRIAKDIGVPPRRINEIVHGKRGVSPDTALRLSRYFGMSERFWMNLRRPTKSWAFMGSHLPTGATSAI